MSEAQKLVETAPEPYIVKKYKDGELILLPSEKGFVKFTHVEVTNEIKIDITADETEVKITVVQWYENGGTEIFEYKYQSEKLATGFPWFVYDVCEYRSYLLQSSARELVNDILQYITDAISYNKNRLRQTTSETNGGS